MRDNPGISDALIHAGAGTAQVITLLGLIPGFIPAVALTAVLTVVLVGPFVILAVAVALAVAPFYLASRIIRQARRRRRREQPPRKIRPVPIPTPGVS